MKHLLPTLLTALLCSGLFAQTFTLNSYTAGGSTGDDAIRDIVTDANGNTYVTGYFSGTVDFDPGTGVYNLTTPAGNKYDAFVQKLDANGNLLWAKSFRGTYDDYEMGENLEVDDTGNVYVQGSFQRNIFFTFSGTQWPGVPNVSVATAGTSPFLVKLDNLGNVKWGLGWQCASPSKPFWATDLELTLTGKIYMTGTYSDSVDFDPTSTSVKRLTNNSGWSTDAYVVKLSNSGQVLDVNNFGLFSKANSVDSDSSGIFIADQNELQKIDANFNVVWSTQIEPTISELKVSPNGYIYLGGVFQGVKDFDPSPTSTYLLNGGGSRAFFILKLDTAGNFIWAKAMQESSSTKYVYGLSLSDNEDVALSGCFSGTLDADPDTLNYLFTSAGLRDGFVLVLDSSGTFKAAAAVGSAGNENFRAAHFKSNNEILVAGDFQNTVDIDPKATATNITSNGQSDFFMLNLGLCSNLITYFTDTACGSYTLPSGNATYITSGTYTDVLTSTQGCDSVLEINVSIVQNNLNPTINQTNNGLEGYVLGGSSALQWEWIDCQTGLAVPSATNQIFMPTYNGSFRVKVSDGICTDTSSCFSINNVSVSENDLAKNVFLYPNPTTGKLKISSSEKIEKIEVYDLLGREVLVVQSTEGEVDLSKLSTGVYLVKIKTEKSVAVRRVVKE